MLALDKILSRADEVTISSLLGSNTVALLGKIHPDHSKPKALKELVLDSLGWEGLLLDATIRNRIIDLFRTEEAEELWKLLSGKPSKNFYQDLKNISIPIGSEKEKRLFAFFGLVPPTWENSKIYEQIETIEPEYQAFPHQMKLIADLKNILQEDNKRVIVHMPTGSGKTRTTMNFICEYFRENPGSLIIWLAYSEELCEQALAEFTRSWKHLGNAKAKMIRFFGSYPLPRDLDDNTFLVCGLAKMVKAIEQNNDLFNELMPRLKLIVMDEAHQAIAPTYKNLLNKLTLRSANLIGLTATPGRSYGEDEQNRALAIFFQNHKIEMEVVGYSSAVDYLIENHYLSRTKFLEIEGAREGILTQSDISSVQSAMDIPNEVLKKLADDEFRNISILRSLVELHKKHSRILYFAPSLENAEHISFLLKVLKVNAYIVSSKKEKRYRREIIHRYLSDDPEPMIICNFGILTTGFDAPKTSCVVIGRPTRSLVLYSQMAGRAIRGLKAGGNAEAEVYTVIDTSLKGFGTIQDAFIHWNNYYNQSEV